MVIKFVFLNKLRYWEDAYKHLKEEASSPQEVKLLEETAREMSLGVTKLMKTSVGVGITGIAGPNSDGTDKKVGLIFISITHNGKTDVIKLENNFSDDIRYKNRFTAVKTVLNFLGNEEL